MNSMERDKLRTAFKEQFGFLPPCNVGAAELGQDMDPPAPEEVIIELSSEEMDDDWFE